MGTRAYVRAGLTYSHSLLSAPYVVHELRLPEDSPTAGDELPLHSSERPGLNLIQDEKGVWRNIFKADNIAVSAAPIAHSVPCVGYVVQEAPIPGKMDPGKYVPALKRTGAAMKLLSALQQGESVTLPDGTVLQGPPRRPGRKIAILGDTHDPSPIAQLAEDVDVLIHEATNAYLPTVDPGTKAEETEESVEARARSHGHSTPAMAGAFARKIGAQQLVLNHFSSRYRGDDDVNEKARQTIESLRGLAVAQYGTHRNEEAAPLMEAIEKVALELCVSKANLEARTVMEAIRSLAITSFRSDAVQCARDFMSIDIVPRKE
jgi:ribonuclease Z